MGHGGGWPPNSLAEWVVGQNFRGQLSASAPQRKNPVVKVELSEDEISGEETISLTYPRGRGSSQKSPSSRKVRFDGDRQPLKSAMKKKVSSSESSDTLIDSDDDDTSITDDESSVIDDSDISEDDVPLRRRQNKAKKSTKKAICKKETDSDSSAAKDALPHETCPCDECVRGRKILKAVIKFEVRKKAAEKNPKGKGRKKGKKDEALSPEPSDTTGLDTTEAEATEDDQNPPEKGKNKKQKQKQKQQSTSPESSPKAVEHKKTVNKDAFKMPTYPKEMQPNWIMPPHTKVVRIEHAVENENDPKPNAFFDTTKGITRVYHGPVFGNHLGELYGNYNTDKLMPPGTGYPPDWNRHCQNGMFIPGPPPVPHGSHFGPNMPLINGQMPPSEEFMRDAASKGFGLSGMPAPSPVAQKATSQHAGSDKGSNGGFGAWDAAAFNTGGADNWGKTNDSHNNGWSGGGGGGWDNGGSKKDGVASPHNFGTWNQNENSGEKFERRSNKSGSQKDGNGNGKHSSQFAASGPKSPLKEPFDKPKSSNGSIPGHINPSQEASGGYNIPPPGLDYNVASSVGSNAPPKGPSGEHASRPGKNSQSSDIAISPEKPTDNLSGGGGDTTWRTGNDNNVGNAFGWNKDGENGKSGWDQAGGAGNTWDAGNDANGWVNKSPHGSKKNSPQQKTGQNDWPPSSKPPSHNGSLNGNGGRSQRNSPPYQGAHAWPSGSKPPINTGGWDKNSTKLASNNDYDKNNHGYNNEGGYSNGGYGTPRGAPGNSKTGQQAGPQTPYWQDASNRATGPSHAGSWRNADLAQHTGGKADQW